MLSFTDTDRLMYGIKMEDVYEDFIRDKKMFDFSNNSPKSKYYDSNWLVVGKMEDQTGGMAIIEFVELKSQICIRFWYMMVVNMKKQKM